MTTPDAEDVQPLRLDSLGFALLAPDDAAEGMEAEWLRSHRRAAIETGQSAEQLLAAWSRKPPSDDRRLHGLAVHLRLTPIEALAVALARAVEVDAMAGRAVAYLQQPTGGSRPTVGLITAAASGFDAAARPSLLAALADGAARRTGLLVFDGSGRVLPEEALSVPVPLALALDGVRSAWPGIRTGLEDPLPLPPSCREEAVRWAAALKDRTAALVIRARDPAEAAAAALLVAWEVGLEPAFIDGDPPAGVGPWLHLTSRLPVLVAETSPGARRSVPSLPGYQGPVIVSTGLDGGWDRGGEPVLGWRVETPAPEERVALWRAALGDEGAAERLGRQHRHGAGRIHGLSRAAHTEAARDGSAASFLHVVRAGREGAAADLGALAERLPEAIDDDALVLSTPLRREMEALLARCAARDALVERLGPAARARYRPGVRVLLHGPSGTGKTLAAGWLATRLGLPLYRVDLATVTSKYIGETEKNLSQLFARAEHAEVVLLFDEADALFGKRTEVRDSNDRYANAQTNYLLQRMEGFEGIAILASNGRSRFDAAFARRLDVVIEFPLPSPEERRALWLAHLGDDHRLTAAQVNRLAAGCDLAGGHIRNAVLAAASRAGARGTALEYDDVVHGVAQEYRKLGRQVPAGLNDRDSVDAPPLPRTTRPGAEITS